MKNISLNYGAVRDTVYRFAGKQFIVNENDGKTAESTILNSFLKSVKSTPSLKMQNIIFENFEKGRFDKESLAERYIAQNLKLAENTITWEKLITENRDIRISLLENCHVEGESDVKSDLYENIHTLLESVCRKGFTEINKANDAYDAVLTHLLRKESLTTGPAETINETEEYPKFLSRDFITKLAVNNFNKRYAHLNENEKSLLKVLLSPDENKSNYLNDLKNENVEMIDSILNSGTDEGSEKILTGFKEKMLSEEKVSNMDESIIHLAELKETLENFKR